MLVFAARVARGRSARSEADEAPDLVAFGLAWFLLHAFVPYALVSRLDVINERHAYVANVGLFLAAGALAARVRVSERVRGASTALGCALLVALTVRRNLEYRSPLALWENTVREAPRNPRAWNDLGVVHELLRDLDAARAHYLRAVALDARFAPAHQNLARTAR